MDEGITCTTPGDFTFKQYDLNEPSSFTSLLTPSFLKRQQAKPSILGMASLAYDYFMCLFTLSADGKLKSWNAINRQFIKSMDLFTYDQSQIHIKSGDDYILNSGSHQNLALGTCNSIKLFDLDILDPTHPGFERESVSFKLMVYLDFVESQSEFVILGGVYGRDGQLTLEVLERQMSAMTDNFTLVDFSIDLQQGGFNCWTVWEDEQAVAEARTFQLLLGNIGSVTSGKRWMPVKTIAPESVELPAHYDSFESLDQKYLAYITEPGRFSPSLFRRIIPNFSLVDPPSPQIQAYVGSLIQSQSMDTKSSDFFAQLNDDLEAAWGEFMNQLLNLHSQSMRPSTIVHNPELGCAIIHHRGGALGYLRKADIAEYLEPTFSSLLPLVPSSVFNVSIRSPCLKSYLRDTMHIRNLALYLKDTILAPDALFSLEKSLFESGIHDLDMAGLVSQLYERHFEAFPEDRPNMIGALFTTIGDVTETLKFIIHILSCTEIYPENDVISPIPEILGNCLKNVVNSRYQLLLDSFIVIFCVNNYAFQEKISLDIISQIFNLLVAYSKLKWISMQQFIAPVMDGLEDRFSGQLSMNINNPATLVEYLFLNHAFVNGDSNSYSDSILHATHKFIQRLGYISRPVKAALHLSSILINYRQPSKALQLLESLAPTSSAMELLGQAHLALDNYENSRVCFERAIDFDRNTVIRFYMDRDLDDLVIHFAKLAYAVNPHENLAKIIFTHCLKVDDCEGAYNSMMMVPESMYNQSY